MQRRSSPNYLWKHADKTSKGHPKAFVLKLIEEKVDMTSKGLAKALILKLIEETSRLDFEKSCKGARPQTN